MVDAKTEKEIRETWHYGGHKADFSNGQKWNIAVPLRIPAVPFPAFDPAKLAEISPVQYYTFELKKYYRSQDPDRVLCRVECGDVVVQEWEEYRDRFFPIEYDTPIPISD